MAETVESAFTWSGRALDAGQIESELARLRYGAAGEPAGGPGLAIRTSLLNFVACAQSAEAAREVSNIIAGLAGHHPSRALIVVPELTAGESRIDADLAAHCHIAAGLDQQVCCEEVILTVSGPAARHLHSVVIPLLVPDLPVYVWWTGGLPEDAHVFEEMLETADRFIVDSAHFADPAADLRRLTRLCAEAPACAIGDLNWKRLDPWRQLVSRYCEMPGVREKLSSVREVKLGFAGGSSGLPSSQALLLLGWLAERSRWESPSASGDGSGTLGFRSEGQPVSAELRPRDYRGLPEGWLVSLGLRGANERSGASVSITRMGDLVHAAVHVQDGRWSSEDYVRIDRCDVGDMLAHELDSLGREPEYESSVERAVAIGEALKRAAQGA